MLAFGSSIMGVTCMGALFCSAVGLSGMPAMGAITGQPDPQVLVLQAQVDELAALVAFYEKKVSPWQFPVSQSQLL